MNEKLALSFSVATFVAAVSMVWFLRGTMDRLADLEHAVAARPADAHDATAGDQPLRGVGRPAGATVDGGSEPLDVDAILGSSDALKKLNHVIEKLERMADDDYDTYNEIATDLLQLKKEVGRTKMLARRIAKGLREGGGPGFTSALPPAGKPLDQEARRKLVDQAAQMGVKVDEGRVTVRGFLNLSPNTNMPIEYFMARFPEASHETLMHIVGNKSPEEVNANPYGALAGLPTNVYKALLAAGFAEGKAGHPHPDSDPKNPRWVLPEGDVVYLYVRWTLDGTEHIARATDWVIDPSTGRVLPHDCLKFTGSMRFEDPESGDETVMTEQSGLIVSVWPNRTALIEVGLKSAAANNYQYNFRRIPKSEGQLSLDLIFSRTPIEVQGEGAKDPMAPGPVEPKDDGEGDDK